MSHNAKWILGCLGVIGFLIICAVVAVFVLIRVFDSPESQQAYQDRKAEGKQFGKTLASADCIKEGLARAKSMTRFEISRAVDNEAFVEGCLEASRRPTDFCKDVPPFWKLQDNDWTRDKCEQAGMDYMRTGCTAVFDAQISVCRNEK